MTGPTLNIVDVDAALAERPGFDLLGVDRGVSVGQAARHHGDQRQRGEQADDQRHGVAGGSESAGAPREAFLGAAAQGTPCGDETDRRHPPSISRAVRRGNLLLGSGRPNLRHLAWPLDKSSLDVPVT